jgi:hypothetical protein
MTSLFGPLNADGQHGGVDGEGPFKPHPCFVTWLGKQYDTPLKRMVGVDAVSLLIKLKMGFERHEQETYKIKNDNKVEYGALPSKDNGKLAELLVSTSKAVDKRKGTEESSSQNEARKTDPHYKDQLGVNMMRLKDLMSQLPAGNLRVTQDDAKMEALVESILRCALSETGPLDNCFFSFCAWQNGVFEGVKRHDSWIDAEQWWHCRDCGTCRESHEWHCTKCNECRPGITIPCEKCGGVSEDYHYEAIRMKRF